MQLCPPRPGMDILSQWQARLVERQDCMPGELPGDSSAAAGIVWQANLPRNPYTARRMLQQYCQYQANARQALPHAEQRLQVLTGQIAQVSAGSGPYGLELDENALPVPERALYTWLDQAQQGDSFSITEDLKEAGQQITGLYQMLVHLGKGDDWVNTDHDGHPLGRSRVSRLGNMDTYFAPGTPLELVALHQQHLQTCQASRLAWIRIGLMTAAFAVRLASSLAFPVSWLTAAGPIVRFIKQVFAEYGQLSNTIPSPPQ